MCDCIDRCNEALAEQNAALDIPCIVDLRTGQQVLPHRAQLMLYKLDPKKRGRLPWLAALYCPFCGNRYINAEPQPTTPPAE